MFFVAGHLQMYRYSPFVVTSSADGEPRPIYGGLYTVGGYGEGYCFPTWVATYTTAKSLIAARSLVTGKIIPVTDLYDQ
jgi:hypothetical protein